MFDSEYNRKRHYELQRNVRTAMGVRLCHTRVRPTSGVGHYAWSQSGRRPSRTCFGFDGQYNYPEGHIVFWSPDRPTFRAMVMYEQCIANDGAVRWDELSYEIIAWQARHSSRTGEGMSAVGTMPRLPYVLRGIQKSLRYGWA